MRLMRPDVSQVPHRPPHNGGPAPGFGHGHDAHTFFSRLRHTRPCFLVPVESLAGPGDGGHVASGAVIAGERRLAAD